jgi:hypothetical protein
VIWFDEITAPDRICDSLSDPAQQSLPIRIVDLDLPYARDHEGGVLGIPAASASRLAGTAGQFRIGKGVRQECHLATRADAHD